jgi:hypothetical protein
MNHFARLDESEERNLFIVKGRWPFRLSSSNEGNLFEGVISFLNVPGDCHEWR